MAGSSRRSDDEWASRILQKSHHFPKINRTKPSKCFVCLFTFTVALCIAALVFATAVLRAGHPHLHLTAVSVSRLSSGVANNVASLSLSAAAELKLHNCNFGRFRYQAGTVTVVYGDATLGRGKIEGGVVPGRKAARINAVVEVKADDYVGRNSSFVGEVGSGNLVKMQWFGEVRGEYRVMKILKMHSTSFMNCSLSLNLGSKTVQDLQC